MEDKRKDMIEDNEIDHLLQQLYGFSDEQLLRDFKVVTTGIRHFKH